MYYIQHNIELDWIYVFRDHMLKAKRLVRPMLVVEAIKALNTEYYVVEKY